MKLVIDEKVKHRLIGLAVIISLAAIFAPAMLKKSNQNVDKNYSVRVQLPPKPEEPNVAITDEREVFKTIKVARVAIPEVSEDSQLPELAKAEVLHTEVIATRESSSLEKTAVAPVQTASKQAVEHTVAHAVQVAAIKPKLQVKPKVIARNTAQPIKTALTIAPSKAKIVVKSQSAKAHVAKEIYAVQLASFSQLANAQALINKLRSKGYKASVTKIPGKNGSTYKVFAGHSSQRAEVVKLKTQLASAMQLNGFIVNTGVS